MVNFFPSRNSNFLLEMFWAEFCPPNSFLVILTPGAQNVTIFRGKKIGSEVIKAKWGH
jgi:hypothetical protein